MSLQICCRLAPVWILISLSSTPVIGQRQPLDDVPGKAPNNQELPSKENFHLFILAGQSNMAGRGKVAPEDKTAHPRVLVFNQAGQWVPAKDPLHFDKPKIVGVGLGRSFAIQVAKAHPKKTIGLIPCAVGGSPIDSWKPGGYHRQTKTHPWDDAMKRIKAAAPHGEIKAILWHQGESDSNKTLAADYEAKLHDLIARFRKELDAPNLPFLAGQMGQFPERPWNEFRKTVDQAHRDLPGKVTHTAFIDSNGLTHKGDQVHFDAKSYRELGQRFAKTYLKTFPDR